MSEDLIGRRVTFTPATNSERTAVARWAAGSWVCERVATMRGGRLEGQPSAFLIPHDHRGQEHRQDFRWVPVDRVTVI